MSVAPPNIDITSPVVLTLPGMERVEVLDGLAFHRTSDGRELRLDRYAPGTGAAASGSNTNGGPLPAVVFVHGSTAPVLLRGVRDWGQYRSWGRLVAASGLAAVIPEHRGFAEAKPCDLSAEVDGAVAYVRSNATALGVDPERLAVFGISAGVPLAIRAAATAKVRCLVAYYGLLDILPDSAAARAGLGPELSALTLLRASRLPPLLVVRAGNDHPQLNQTIDAFTAEALTRNHPFELLNHPAGHHSFDTRDNTESSRHIVARTLQFLHERLS